MIPWLHWVFIAGLVDGAIVRVLVIGTTRKPVTVGDAAVTVLVNVLLILALVFFK